MTRNTLKQAAIGWFVALPLWVSSGVCKMAFADDPGSFLQRKIKAMAVDLTMISPSVAKEIGANPIHVLSSTYSLTAPPMWQVWEEDIITAHIQIVDMRTAKVYPLKAKVRITGDYDYIRMSHFVDPNVQLDRRDVKEVEYEGSDTIEKLFVTFGPEGDDIVVIIYRDEKTGKYLPLDEERYIKDRLKDFSDSKAGRGTIPKKNVERDSERESDRNAPDK